MTMTQYLRNALIVNIFIALGGCSAMGDGWPSLAGDPPAEPVALLDPVDLPPPSPLQTTMTVEEARALLSAMPDLMASLDMRISSQYESYQTAKAALKSDTDTDMAGTARRTAEFQLSRLSRLETELSQLLRKAQGMTLTLADTSAAKDARSLTEHLRAQSDTLSAFLIRERRALAQSET